MDYTQVRQSAVDQACAAATFTHEKGIVLALVYIGDAILRLSQVIDDKGRVY